MISYPFTAKPILDEGGQPVLDVNGFPTYDRTIDSAMERAFNKQKWTNGVYSYPADGLQVVANNGMKVTLKRGGCQIEGAQGYNQTDLDITCSPSHSSLARIDRVVVRFDLNDSIRGIEVYKKEGTFSSVPVAPEITQEANYYELAVADVKIRKGATEITQADITDQRLNSDLCGVVIPAIPTPLDTSTLYNQYQDSLDQYLSFVASAINETLAGELQTQITENATAIDAIVGVVYPIGSIYSSTVSTSPATLFGGTWEQIKDKFLLSAGDDYSAGDTGGKATHTLTIKEMPAHKHTDAEVRSPIAYTSRRTASIGTDGAFIQDSEMTKSRGGGAAHNNMPPYEVVYSWKRIA